MHFKRYNILFLFITTLVLSFYIPVQSADQDFFDVFGLEIEGLIYGYTLADVNGDELMDIAMVYSKPDNLPVKYLGLYLQDGSTGFNVQPDYLIELDSATAQIDGGDIDGDGKDEILSVDGNGVTAVSLSEAGGLVSNGIINTRTIYSFPLFNGILDRIFLVDINGVPGAEIIIPTPKGYTIYERDENNNFQILNRLNVPIACGNTRRGLSEFTLNSGARLLIDLADIHARDGNGDGRVDLYFLWDRMVCIFFQDESGNFAQSPDVRVNVFPANANGMLQSRLKDFNGDNRPDLAVSYTTGGITSAETKIRFHMADADGRIQPFYRKEITLSDSHCNLLVDDYDGNQQVDLAVAAVELGALAVTQMFLMKKTNLHLLIYPFKDGLPEDEPVKRIKYDFRFNFDDPMPTGEISLDWSSDFSGDNRYDLVFIDGRGTVSFYWGQAEDYLSRKPDLEINLEHPARVYPVHLNSGRNMDIVIRHNFSGRFDRLTVLRNKSNIR